MAQWPELLQRNIGIWLKMQKIKHTAVSCFYCSQLRGTIAVFVLPEM